MPGLKYKDNNGEWQILNQVMVKGINVVQTTGASSADVMSQSAVTEALQNVHIDVDQVIDSGTSASTNAVSTSAVYNAIANSLEIEISSGVTPIDDNIEIWIDESEDPTEIEVYRTSDAITGMSGYSVAASGTPITSADTLNQAIGKLEKQNDEIVDFIEEKELAIAASLTDLDDRTTTVETKILDNDEYIANINRRTRKDFTSSGLTWFINTLKSAVADQNLEKYGLKVGDYVSATHDSKTYNYVIAGLNTMKGTSTPYRLNVDHVGIIVDTTATQAWNVSGNTYQSTNTYSTGGTWTTGASAAGYANCDLHYYLTNTVLPYVKTDLGSANIKSHYKLYTNNVNTSGYNRFGSAGGCSSGWAWYTNQEICALSEIQVYGSTVWSSSGYDTGEACRQLDVFRVYNMNEIFEGRYPWLRDVASASHACYVSNYGFAHNYAAYDGINVAALILFA